MKDQEIVKKIKFYSKKEKWNHRYIFGDIETRPISENVGDNEIKWKRISKILKSKDIKSKNILDIGCSDGFFSNKCAKLGAKKVTGLDFNKLRIKRAKFAAKVLNLKNSEFKEYNFYNFSKSKKFHLILALGILHRIPEIFLFIKKISALTSKVLIEFKSLDSEDEICSFVGETKHVDMKSSFYFAPSLNFVIKILKFNGFNKFEINKDTKSNLKFKRTIILAKK